MAAREPPFRLPSRVRESTLTTETAFPLFTATFGDPSKSRARVLISVSVLLP